MKTLNFELCKKLTEKGKLEGVETECYYFHDWKMINWEIAYLILSMDNIFNEEKWDIKAPTLEEALEILPIVIKNYALEIYRCFDWWYNVEYESKNYEKLKLCHWKTLLEAMEKMLEYLLDNDLLNENT